MIDQFQVADDPAFTKSVNTNTIARSAGGQTSTPMTVWSQIDQVHYWRVRASAGETIGEYSASAVFTIGAAPRQRPSGGAPRRVAPADGARTGGNMIVFQAIIGDHSGAPGGGEFEVADSRAFTPVPFESILRKCSQFSGADVKTRGPLTIRVAAESCRLLYNVG